MLPNRQRMREGYFCLKKERHASNIGGGVCTEPTEQEMEAHERAESEHDKYLDRIEELRAQYRAVSATSGAGDAK